MNVSSLLKNNELSRRVDDLTGVWVSGCCQGFNPLTSVPAVSGRDERWPLFHFWHYHLCPKLALSVFKFCRKKRSFQWYPDHSVKLCQAKGQYTKNGTANAWISPTLLPDLYTQSYTFWFFSASLLIPIAIAGTPILFNCNQLGTSLRARQTTMIIKTALQLASPFIEDITRGKSCQRLQSHLPLTIFLCNPNLFFAKVLH